jgi:hypothetical protein
MSYASVLNNYVNDYCDNTLIELEEQKKDIDSLDDLLSFLNFALDHNYFTGHYWLDLYNFDDELENICRELITDDNYFNYLIEACDKLADIFILTDSAELIAIEKENQFDEKLNYIFDNYDRLLNFEEFENIHYLDEYATFDYVNEIYQIPESLMDYIDYDKIIRDFAHDSITTIISENSFINDYNKL